MHSEKYRMTKEVADRLNEAKAAGKRIISVGTTSTRTLESIYTKYGEFRECYEDTNIFIYPGFKFKISMRLFSLAKLSFLVLCFSLNVLDVL